MANLGVVVHAGVGAQVNGLFLRIAQPGLDEAQSGVSQDLGHDLGREAVGEKDFEGLARCKVKSFVVHRELHLVLDYGLSPDLPDVAIRLQEVGAHSELYLRGGKAQAVEQPSVPGARQRIVVLGQNARHCVGIEARGEIGGQE